MSNTFFIAYIRKVSDYSMEKSNIFLLNLTCSFLNKCDDFAIIICWYVVSVYNVIKQPFQGPDTAEERKGRGWAGSWLFFTDFKVR